MRIGAWLAVPVLLVLLLVFAQQRDATLRNRPLLPVYFDHRLHDHIGCIDCHHNYTDDSGFESCYACHKFRHELQVDIEQQFHDLCKSCHVSEHRKGEDSGPLRHCSGCHTQHPPTALP